MEQEIIDYAYGWAERGPARACLLAGLVIPAQHVIAHSCDPRGTRDFGAGEPGVLELAVAHPRKLVIAVLDVEEATNVFKAEGGSGPTISCTAASAACS